MSALPTSVPAPADAGSAPFRPDPASDGVPAASGPAPAVSGIVARTAQANAALMRGDAETYLALIDHTEDFTLMSPFGGTPSRASDLTAERMQALGRFFRNGTFRQEVVQTYASADMVVLAVIERAHVEVGGLPAQDWALRVTLVYRREGADWRLVHRHADPLANGVTLEQSAALARGDAAQHAGSPTGPRLSGPFGAGPARG